MNHINTYQNVYDQKNDPHYQRDNGQLTGFNPVNIQTKP